MAERVIEGSRRPDGTYRKPIRIRAGHKTEELDIEARAYVSKGTVHKANVAAAGVPGASAAVKPKTEKEIAQAKAEARRIKRAKQKEAKQNASSSKEDAVPQDEMSGLSLSDKTKPKPQPQATIANKTVTSTEDPVKRKKKLEKTLKQIAKLEDKVAAGEALSADEQSKVSKKEEVLAEMATL
eukprot:gb/GEZN01016903.1/.p1 GENE.gb/GEZN01016903.1/~~gb/GEZN01016903.1/.p1  ORF type:complete len:183 (+),score=55.72 gb/GEZN01016903.1/:39-587(+)